MASPNTAASSISSLLSRMQYIASDSTDVESDLVAQASILQLTHELTHKLQQPGDAISSWAYSVRSTTHCQLLICFLKFGLSNLDVGRWKHLSSSGSRPWIVRLAIRAKCVYHPGTCFRHWSGRTFDFTTSSSFNRYGICGASGHRLFCGYTSK